MTGVPSVHERRASADMWPNVGERSLVVHGGAQRAFQMGLRSPSYNPSASGTVTVTRRGTETLIRVQPPAEQSTVNKKRNWLQTQAGQVFSPITRLFQAGRPSPIPNSPFMTHS